MPAQEKAYERRLAPVQSPVTAPHIPSIRTQEISKPCTCFFAGGISLPGARSESRLPFKALPPVVVKGGVTSCRCRAKRIPWWLALLRILRHLWSGLLHGSG